MHTNKQKHMFVPLMFLSTACVSSCEFDKQGNLCGWMTEGENTDTGFKQCSIRGTDTGCTGPVDDFSKPGCKWFLSFEVCV